MLGLKRNGGMEEDEEDEDDAEGVEEEAKLVDEEEPWAELNPLVGNTLCKSVRK